ncbi:MAG: hypothetical protein HY274_07855 [Gammaproteobacteria bacterium]|nr:hypothetical protein [Gammaproteobacteria bacterium]
MNITSSGRHAIIARFLAALMSFISFAHSAQADPTDPGGGIGGTGITGFGVVQKFGSIFVNGREYFLDNRTHVTREDALSDEKMLRLGDVVRVEGRIDPSSGKSMAISVDSHVALQGRVEKVDVTSGTVTMLGQTVRVTSATLGDTPENGALLLTRLHSGTRIAVSGFARSDGSWTATRIDPIVVDDSRFVLRGAVQTTDPGRGQFRIGGQLLTMPAGLLSAQPKMGDVVRIIGHYGDAALQIESVKSDRLMIGAVGQAVEMGGYIQAQPGAGKLVSNGIELKYSDASAFIGGTVADLHKDIPVAVRGELQADGTVFVRALLINVEPMRVSLPELDRRTPRETPHEQRNNREAGEKLEREKPTA